MSVWWLHELLSRPSGYYNHYARCAPFVIKERDRLEQLFLHLIYSSNNNDKASVHVRESAAERCAYCFQEWIRNELISISTLPSLMKESTPLHVPIMQRLFARQWKEWDHQVGFSVRSWETAPKLTDYRLFLIVSLFVLCWYFLYRAIAES
eukprot:TRINITY_DN7475_c0_g1_i1.p1 TRINITY_DN7475_c0_g1~~TRINITY_DN7475_c0_g1_i1.p1  ORF type:complete len:160 (+),score=27.17 TRINITY_DN7475_c0_g1_i1:30-482(+)